MGSLYLEISHRGIRLADYLECLAGEHFFRLVLGCHHFAWVVLNADRLNHGWPDAVFIPDGVNQGIVYEQLLTQLGTAQ